VIEFRWSKMDKQDNTPILKDTEIDELAEMLLADYKPQLLKEPTNQPPTFFRIISWRQY